MLIRYEQATVLDLDPALQAWDWGGGRGLLLHGPKGTGKTHAAVAMWKDWQARNPAQSLDASAPFVSLARLMQEKRRSFDGKETPGWAEPNWKSVRFVVFDDWDKCRWSEWVAEEMFSIIDTLYCRMVPIIVTSNLTPAEFARHSGEYVTDRIKEMVVPVPMLGQSRRKAPDVRATGTAAHPGHASRGNGLPSPADCADAGPAAQPEQQAEPHGALARVRPTQDGVGREREAPASDLSPAERDAAEAHLRVLLGHAARTVAR